MLDILRKAAGTWVAKLLLLLLVVSFGIWGITGKMVGGFGANQAVVSAGRTTVSPVEYRLAYERQLAIIGQQLGTRVTREQAKTFGIEDQVLQQVAAGAVLDEQARGMGLGLSKDKLAALTMEDPAFQGPDGQFNRQQFEYALSQIGMRPADYLRNRAQVAVRQQIVDAVSEGLKAPDTFLRAVALYQGEDRTVEYLVLPASLVEPIEEPSASALSSFFEENKKTYAAPEYRKVSYVRMLPEDVADEKSISDEQVKADYDKNVARYTTPETRTIQQLVFPSREDAQKAADQIKAGATFESVASAQGKQPADLALGTLAKANVPDLAVADAAFALPVNQVSGVVDGAFGPVLLRVTEIKPAVVKPLAEVAAEIRKALAIGDANAQLTEIRDRYEDGRAAGETLAEAAGKLGLKAQTVDAVSRTGLRPDDSVVKDLPASEELLAAAFDSEVNVENNALPLPGNGYLFFEVQAITPARDRTLDEVRAKVVADWKTAEQGKRLEAKAAELAKRVKDGATLDALATELKLEKQTKRGLKRSAEDGEFGQAGVRAAFGVPEGGSGVVDGDAGKILFKVTEVFEPAGTSAASVPADAQKTFASGISDDLLAQLVARLEAQYDVRVNRTAAGQALSF